MLSAHVWFPFIHINYIDLRQSDRKLKLGSWGWRVDRREWGQPKRKLMSWTSPSSTRSRRSKRFVRCDRNLWKKILQSSSISCKDFFYSYFLLDFSPSGQFKIHVRLVADASWNINDMALCICLYPPQTFHAELHTYKHHIELFNQLTQKLIAVYPADDTSRIKRMTEGVNLR